MQVIRVSGSDGDTFELRGMTEDEAAMLGALADFPQWAEQPKEIGGFCERLHDGVGQALFRTAQPRNSQWPLADAHGFVPATTVND